MSNGGGLECMGVIGAACVLDSDPNNPEPAERARLCVCDRMEENGSVTEGLVGMEAGGVDEAGSVRRDDGDVSLADGSEVFGSY